MSPSFTSTLVDLITFSSIITLNAEIINNGWSTWRGGQGGNFRHTLENSPYNIYKVCVRQGDEIDDIRVVWTDDTKSDNGNFAGGNTGGTAAPCWQIPKTECIYKVDIRAGSRVDALRFYGTGGQGNTGLWGSTGGTLYTAEGAANQCITGVDLWEDAKVDKIRFYFQETSAPTTHPTTSNPTTHPTFDPTQEPTFQPTVVPTTSNPTTHPTFDPTYIPTKIPTVSPSQYPTTFPSPAPVSDGEQSDMASTAFDEESGKRSAKQKSLLDSWIIYLGIGVLVVIILCIILIVLKKRKRSDGEMKQNINMTNTDIEMAEENRTDNTSDTNAKIVNVMTDSGKLEGNDELVTKTGYNDSDESNELYGNNEKTDNGASQMNLIDNNENEHNITQRDNEADHDLEEMYNSKNTITKS